MRAIRMHTSWQEEQQHSSSSREKQLVLNCRPKGRKRRYAFMPFKLRTQKSLSFFCRPHPTTTSLTDCIHVINGASSVVFFFFRVGFVIKLMKYLVLTASTKSPFPPVLIAVSHTHCSNIVNMMCVSFLSLSILSA